ncbi:MAG TPA: glycosyltransferase family 4 protein [Candidatus Acidoferrales bacterium]|nr:glycosyltransferase family 4 protein [Candidatus Acidoferrales bacterium]
MRRNGDRAAVEAARATTPPVAIFTNSMVMGGMEEHVLQLGRGLRERGFPVTVICSSDDAIAPLRDGLHEADVEVRALSAKQASLGSALPRVRELAAALRPFRGGVLHIHMTGHRGGALTMLAARLAGVRAIVRSVHLPPTGRVGRQDRVLVGITDRQLARIVCVSSETRRAHVDALGRDPRKCVVVHNGVDLERFSPDVPPIDLRAEFGIAPTAPVVGTVARLGETRKGMHHFVDAAALIAARAPDTRFLVVGDGELRTALESRARERGLGERVVFAGQRADVPRVLTALSVFVSPSIYEACQYNLLEAMAAGRAVVSTLTGVAPEVIVDGVTGRAVAIGDPHALAVATLETLAAPAEAARMGARARERILSGFSLDAMLDGLVRVYREVVSG